MEVKEEVRQMSRKVATLEDILSDFILITERDNRQLREDLRAIGNRNDGVVAYVIFCLGTSILITHPKIP